jgi:transcriptional regulator with XRE-family HTH domain
MADTDSPSPAVQRRRLRTELRRARLQAGLTQDQVAETMEWSLSKVIRIEAGTVGVSANDLKALLALYKIADEDQVASLLALARAGRERPWQSVYRDIVSPRLLQLIEFEAAASISRNFQPLVVPGLLQTEEYARAMLRQFAGDTPDTPVDARVEVRMKRQEVLDQADPPLLFFILDEAATRRLVGGRDVMRGQLRRMAELAARPHVTIEVVPFSVGAHPGLQGPFLIEEFPDPADDDVLYLESPQGDVLSRDDPDLILHYREVFEKLRHLSLGPEGSLTFLAKLADDMA